MRRDNIIGIIYSQLDAFNSDILKLDEMLSSYSRGKQIDAVIFKRFILLNQKYPSNSLIVSRLLEFLQLVDSEEILGLYTLEDLGGVYAKLAEIFKDDIDINVENYYYLDGVVGNKKEALKTFNKFTKRAAKKIPLITKPQ